MSQQLSKLVFALTLVTSLHFLATPAMAAWVIDLSGSLVEVDELALSGSSPTVAQVSDENAVTGRGDEKPGMPKGDRFETSTTSTDLEALQAKQKKLRTEFQQSAEARRKNLEKNKQQIRTELKAEEDGLTIQQETVDEDGKVVKTKETKLPKEEKLRLERPDADPVEISTDEPAELVVKSTRTRTRTHFPLSVGEDNTLIVTHKDGTQKEVAVLPDAAVSNLEQKGFVLAEEPELIAEGSESVYDVGVKEEKRFLGLFKIVFDKRAQVNAETGDVATGLSSRASAWQRFLDRFSL